jgi:DNA-binding LacI/PurR family transcriptional regulator
MNHRVTIKDVARLAGVTHTTVSRVIRNLPFVRDETRSRVLRALSQLNYQPNLVARSLVKKRSNVIALITPELHPYTHPVVRGVATASIRSDYAIMLIPMDTWLEEDRSIAFVAQNWQVDGIIVYNIIYHAKVPEKVRQIQANKVPIVFVNKFLDQKRINAVGVDNDQCVFLAIEHLFKLGHRRIGSISGGLTSVDGVERDAAFRKAMNHFGLKLEENWIGTGDFNDETACAVMRRILNNKKLPSAMYCANDHMAMGIIRAITEAGLSVPDDISVVGLDDAETPRYSPIPVTTVRRPVEAAAVKAFGMMIDLMRDSTKPPQQIRLPGELVVRGSTIAATINLRRAK